MIRRTLTGLLSITAVVTAASARDLPVPADKGWQHAESGLILTASLDGLARTSLTDTTDSERDVTAQFEDRAAGIYATLYLFRPAIADVGIWFDRARTTLEARPLFRNASPVTADPVAFAAPGSDTASSLRQTYTVLGGEFRSTALAAMPVGQWLVVIRLSARSLDAKALDQRLDTLVAAVRWPAGRATPAALSIAACPVPLAFTKAKPAKTDGADLLMTLMAGAAIEEKKKKGEVAPPIHWCREGDRTPHYTAYRAEAVDGYSLALQDAGRTVDVHRSIMAQINKASLYSVSLNDVDGRTIAFQSFDALPKPDQVYALIEKGQTAGSRKGNQINLPADFGK